MGAAPESSAPDEEKGWTIERAEALLKSLTGVVSARIVGKPGGKVHEIHILTTEEVAPKQTVRNVESALRAHLDLPVDHRKISVAQTREAVAKESVPDRVLQPVNGESLERRILFVGHKIESERAHRVRMQVSVEWRGEHYIGEATGADHPRPRLEVVANATLRGLEAAAAASREDGAMPFALALDGVRVVGAFDRDYALVAVLGMAGREVRHLSGASTIEESTDKAVILATLQATDRWVRGRLQKH